MKQIFLLNTYTVACILTRKLWLCSGILSSFLISAWTDVIRFLGGVASCYVQTGCYATCYVQLHVAIVDRLLCNLLCAAVAIVDRLLCIIGSCFEQKKKRSAVSRKCQVLTMLIIQPSVSICNIADLSSIRHERLFLSVSQQQPLCPQERGYLCNPQISTHRETASVLQRTFYWISISRAKCCEKFHSQNVQKSQFSFQEK